MSAARRLWGWGGAYGGFSNLRSPQIGILEKEMEGTMMGICRGYIWLMEKKMEATIE